MTIDSSALARDPRGSAATPPAVPWPGGRRLALSLVVNFEEGAELSLARGDERNEHVYEIAERVEGVPDACMESHFAYGTRAGWPRIRALLKKYGVRATINACGRAAAISPWLAAEAVADGHEGSSHGWRWERQAEMSQGPERGMIRQAGGAPSPNTRRLLVEHGGFLYDSNEYDDDLPRVETVLGRPHVVLPYAFDTNDMRFFNHGGFVFAEDFARYCCAAFDRLYQEGASASRMMTVGLHLRIIGRPGRIAGLE